MIQSAQRNAFQCCQNMTAREPHVKASAVRTASTVDTADLAKPRESGAPCPLATPPARAGDGREDAIQRVIEARSKNPELLKNIAGALIYLDDTQIRNRPGKHPSYYDSSDGNGCRSVVRLNYPLSEESGSLPAPEGFKNRGQITNFLQLRRCSAACGQALHEAHS